MFKELIGKLSNSGSGRVIRVQVKLPSQEKKAFAKKFGPVKYFEYFLLQFFLMFFSITAFMNPLISTKMAKVII